MAVDEGSAEGGEREEGGAARGASRANLVNGKQHGVNDGAAQQWHIVDQNSSLKEQQSRESFFILRQQICPRGWKLQLEERSGISPKTALWYLNGLSMSNVRR